MTDKAKHNLKVTRQIAAEQCGRREAFLRHFPKRAWPSNEIAERIFGDRVNDNNRNALRRELHNFRAAYYEHRSNTKSRQAARRKQMQTIERSSKALLDRLSKPDWLLDFYMWPLPSMSREQFLTGLQELYDESRAILPEPSAAIKTWCVQKLADIYEKNFNREAGVSRPPDGGTIDGPFPRFVKAVAEEISITISPETIAPALAKRRHIVKN